MTVRNMSSEIKSWCKHSRLQRRWGDHTRTCLQCERVLRGLVCDGKWTAGEEDRLMWGGGKGWRGALWASHLILRPSWCCLPQRALSLWKVFVVLSFSNLPSKHQWVIQTSTLTTKQRKQKWHITHHILFSIHYVFSPGLYSHFFLFF